MTAVAKPRLHWVDAGKGLSILLVVLYHATEWTQAAGFDLPILTYVNEALTDLRMPVFFFLSGLFAAKWIAGTWRALWNSKITLFSWVYLLWSLLELPAKWLGMAVLTDKIGDDFLTRQALVIAAIPFRASGSLWFIWALVLFFVVAKLTARWPLWLQLGLAAAASFAVRALPSDINEKFVDLTGIGYRGALLFYFFFLLGAYFREATVRRVSKLTYGPALAIAAGWLGLWVILEALSLGNMAPVSFVMSLGGVVAGLAIAVLLKRVRLLYWLGSLTLPVYLTHTTVIVAFVSLVNLIPNLPALTGYVIALLAAAVAVAVSLALYSIPRLRYLYETPPFVRAEKALTAPAHRL